MSAFLIDTLVYTGALIVAALLLRRPIARAFGPQAAYALWALPFLRLLLPPIELPAWMAPQAPAPVASAETVVVYAADAAPAAAVPSWEWSDAAVAVWAAGVVAFLVWRTVTYLRMRRSLLAGAVQVGEAGAVRLLECPGVVSPVALGVRDKVVALPPEFMAWHNRKARDLALAHELAHHTGRDLLINILAQPLLALHWFNPLAWAGWRAMRRDQEAACDARVLAGQGGEVRADYGRLIAGLAAGPRLALSSPMACPVVGEKSIIHRLRSLTMPEPTPTRRRIGRGLLIGAALALPLTATIGYAAPDAPAAPELPAAPAAPEAPSAPHVERHVVIVENGKDSTDAKLKTRVIERNGKTIVFKTDKDLSDAEVEAKLAKVEADLAGADVMAMAPDAPAGPGEPQIRRKVIVMSGDGAHMVHGGPGGPEVRVFKLDKDGPQAHAFAMAGKPLACVDGQGGNEVNAETNKDGKKQIVRMRFCGAGANASAHALAGLKNARERMSKNSDMSPEIKAQVLEALDKEIAKLSKGG